MLKKERDWVGFFYKTPAGLREKPGGNGMGCRMLGSLPKIAAELLWEGTGDVALPGHSRRGLERWIWEPRPVALPRNFVEELPCYPFPLHARQGSTRGSLKRES